LNDFGYIGFVGIIFIILGFLTCIRGAYMVAVYVYGKKILSKLLEQDAEANQIYISFEIYPY